MQTAYLLPLGAIDYGEALSMQRSIAAAVAQAAIPDTVLLLEHPPTVTYGRRTGESEVHVPPAVEVEVVETDRGGRSTYHAPGQLVCYPILDLNRYGRDVKAHCRKLEAVICETLAAFDIAGVSIDGLTGVWVDDRKIASIGVHVARWVTTHGFALNVDLDIRPFTEWITACGLENAQFTSMALELGRPVSVGDVVPAVTASLERVFGLELDLLPASDDLGLWPQPVHAQLAVARD
jgi:lipoyl(octanoyl) transferase